MLVIKHTRSQKSLPPLFSGCALVFRLVVLLQAFSYVVRLTDPHQRTQSIVRVWPHKEVNAGAATLGPLHQLF